jgi:hypothetical protein
MIYLSLSLKNPFSNRYSVVYEKSGKTWNPHKFWDLTICKRSSIIGFTFDFNMRQDHAGSGLEIELFGWSIDYRFYDSRHWDYVNNCWEKND